MLRRLSASLSQQALSCAHSDSYQQLLQYGAIACTAHNTTTLPSLAPSAAPPAAVPRFRPFSSSAQRPTTATTAPPSAAPRFRPFASSPDAPRTAAQTLAEAAVPGMRQVSTRVVPKTGWAAVPPVPKFLGLFGLTPFLLFSPPVLISITHATAAVPALAPLTHALTHDLLPVAANLQIGYGTAIVSFLGAVHWGAAMQSRTGHTTKIMFERYIWSVTPALVAFPAAGAAPEMGCGIITMSLLAAFCVDAKFAWKGALPKWYMALRVPLTLGAMAGMLATMWHEQAERQRILDYEHAVAEVPLTLDQETEAAMYR